jgi:hypothetical protein
MAEELHQHHMRQSEELLRPGAKVTGDCFVLAQKMVARSNQLASRLNGFDCSAGQAYRGSVFMTCATRM